jgi:hypothetical protein
MVWCGPLHLAFPGDVAEEEEDEKEEEEGGTPHIDTCRNARLWVDFFGGLH